MYAEGVELLDKIIYETLIVSTAKILFSWLFQSNLSNHFIKGKLGVAEKQRSGGWWWWFLSLFRSRLSRLCQ